MNAFGPYTGVVNIQIDDSQKAFHVRIETEHLNIASAQREEVSEYHQLFNDASFQKGLGIKNEVSAEEIAARVVCAAARSDLGEPFHMMSVRNKKNEFLGMILPGYTSDRKPGVSLLSGGGFSNYQHNGLGIEAATAILHGYLPVVMEKGKKANNELLSQVIAQVAPTNERAKRLLQIVGMKPSQPTSKSLVYSIDSSELGFRQREA